jgi:hypothetical protein
MEMLTPHGRRARSLRLAAGIASWAVSLLFTPAFAQELKDERFVSDTAFRVEHDAIWDYFAANGQVSTFGMPVSRTFTLLGCRVQIFQRSVVQVCPDEQARALDVLEPELFPYANLEGQFFKAVLLGEPRVGPEFEPDFAEWAYASRFFAQYCPDADGWLCRGGELPDSDLTLAFDPQSDIAPNVPNEGVPPAEPPVPTPTTTAEGQTPTRESTATPLATQTPTPTNRASQTPDATSTPTPTETASETPTPTPTATPTPTPTATQMPTATPAPTQTPTPTDVPTATPTVGPNYEKRGFPGSRTATPTPQIFIRPAPTGFARNFFPATATPTPGL